VLIAALLGQGCAAPGRRLQYLLGEENSFEHYRDYATAIEYPTEAEASPSDPDLFAPPRSLTSVEDAVRRPITLQEAIRLALENSKILVENQTFGSPANPLMSNPAAVASVYDTGIQETGFLFGNRGTEAALSDFDPLFTNNMQWGRTEDPQNSPNLGLPSGASLVDETAQWQARLEKNLANSGTVAVEHTWNYSQNNNTRLFPSAYTGFLGFEYRQPLLAGSGTEFTRIAGPLSQNLRGVSGVSQGVVISRINTDISLLDFEQSVSTTVRDVESKYWDFYLALQLYQSEIDTLTDITDYYHILRGREDAGDAVSQAANRLYESDARVRGSLADVLKEEQLLRRLLGLPLNDGTFLVPADDPTEAELVPEWQSSLLEALANRPELRKQKWQIRSLELQLVAAKNVSRPRLDFVSQYRINGFGDNLTGEEDDDGLTDTGFASAYESLTQGDNTAWNLGFSFAMPVGLRLLRAQVRNYELRLRKAREALAMQEREVARELNDAMLEMQRWYALAETGARRANENDRLELAAVTRVKSERERRPESIGRALDAKISSREADQGYLRSVIEYNKAVTLLNFRKGMTLAANSILLAEGEWNPPAYEDARERGEAMSHALDNTHVMTEPPEFSGGPGPNSWESTGNPNRPFVPGQVPEGAATMPGPESAVPQVPPADAVPQEEQFPAPEPRPERDQPNPLYDSVSQSGTADDAVEVESPWWFSGISFKRLLPEGKNSRPVDNSRRRAEGRARMSTTGKPGI
jgi:hypothetical protein